MLKKQSVTVVPRKPSYKVDEIQRLLESTLIQLASINPAIWQLSNFDDALIYSIRVHSPRFELLTDCLIHCNQLLEEQTTHELQEFYFDQAKLYLFVSDPLTVSLMSYLIQDKVQQPIKSVHDCLSTQLSKLMLLYTQLRKNGNIESVKKTYLARKIYPVLNEVACVINQLSLFGNDYGSPER
ncbi:MAG: hypothetical protein [Bacteriophage sp.]|nr:MAG: hypothetical protein [Bacteriophage sp.]